MWNPQKSKRACELVVAGAVGWLVGVNDRQAWPAALWWGGIGVTTAVQVTLVVYTQLRMREELRVHRERIDAEWARTEADLVRVNAEADHLNRQVVHQAKRFRETFGIEALPALDPRYRVN